MKKIIGLLLLIGSIAWSVTMVKSGWVYSFGLGFWGPNGHDGIWHLALANSLAKGTFENPVFAGEVIKNYHLGFDLILAFFHKITFIDTRVLYFQIIPPILALLVGFFCYKFVFLWTKSLKASLLAIIFVYFGGSLSWIIGKGESAFWSQQAISTLVNPPFALSLVLMLLGFIYLLKKKYLISSLFFGLLIFVKVYAGLLVLGGLFVVGIYELLKNKERKIIYLFLAVLMISITLFIPFNKFSTGLIKFQPFWFLETLMAASDRLGWEKFYSAMQTYKAGKIYLKEIIAYGVAFLIFVVGNFGTRLIFLKEVFKKLDTVKLIILAIIAAGLVIPTFFVQEGTPWNTIQFIYYSLFLSAILAGISLERVKNIFVYLILLLTLPTTIITLKDVYIPGRPPAKLSTQEFAALTFLKNEPEGVVLTYPFDTFKAREAVANPPRPLYLYESTAYVAAFSGKKVFLEDEVNLNILNYSFNTRKSDIEDWYKESNEDKAREFLTKNKILYIYWVKPQRALLGDKQLGLKQIFENEAVIIYKYGQNLSGN